MKLGAHSWDKERYLGPLWTGIMSFWWFWRKPTLDNEGDVRPVSLRSVSIAGWLLLCVLRCSECCRGTQRLLSAYSNAFFQLSKGASNNNTERPRGFVFAYKEHLKLLVFDSITQWLTNVHLWGKSVSFWILVQSIFVQSS